MLLRPIIQIQRRHCYKAPQRIWFGHFPKHGPSGWWAHLSPQSIVGGIYHRVVVTVRIRIVRLSKGFSPDRKIARIYDTVSIEIARQRCADDSGFERSSCSRMRSIDPRSFQADFLLLATIQASIDSN